VIIINKQEILRRFPSDYVIRQYSLRQLANSVLGNEFNWSIESFKQVASYSSYNVDKLDSH